MFLETIAVYFSPLPSTKVAALVGLGMAYHMAVVYTDASGVSHGASSGPSNSMGRQTPSLALDALVKSADNAPSGFGTLASDPKNNHPFRLGYPEDYYTQDFNGEPFPHALVIEGPDLALRWRLILQSYEAMGRLHLTYSPISQNSNSMAGNALRRAGLAIPFSSQTVFAPAEFTHLPAPDSLPAQESGAGGKR